MEWGTCCGLLEPKSRNVSCPASCFQASVLKCQQYRHELWHLWKKSLCGTKVVLPLLTGGGNSSESGQIFQAGLSSDVLHAADSGIAFAVEL